MTNAAGTTERTRAVILEAAARVLGRRPDAAMAEIADEAGVGRATLYRHFPTRDSLLQGAEEAGIAELTEGIEAANLGGLSVERAIARLTSVFMRTGAKYAAFITQDEDHPDSVDKQRVIQPVREVIDRGVREGVLRADPPTDVLFEMFSALLERSLWLTVAGTITPEAATDAVVDLFLDGARKVGPAPVEA
ncbi:TetR/AcrR family transcriptional regulator [Mycobacterium sp. AZCC_0083]|uniref:TetR/AcrR family transcriptional regulator n=1 Tax=Mycobacterium sp. AZCC_0083 TaxID=2735882 RepID=UPI0016172885|nr:TetR/AcrR family transcriptional regulator [Mycobacterium sp. AZCC_0083]MBB5166168.1 AcrR family transcriptional regulator [Mycobacterium sp. AZCC_0083]